MCTFSLDERTSGIAIYRGHLEDQLTAALVSDPASFEENPLYMPWFSLYDGVGGLAYCAFRLATYEPSDITFATVAQWCQNALEQAEYGRFPRPMPPPPGSIFHTVAGIHWLNALARLKQGDKAEASIGELLSAASAMPRDTSDLFTGRAGLLLAYSQLLRAATESSILLAAVTESANALFHSLTAALVVELPLQTDCVLTINFAHGSAGIVYAVLHYCETIGVTPPNTSEKHLETLATLAQPVGKGLCWPVATPEPLTTQAWCRSSLCNGAAGMVHLWTLAARLFSRDEYLQLARRAAFFSGQLGKPGPTSVCCGLTGRAYALLNIYRATREELWLKRATELGNIAMAVLRGQASIPSNTVGLFSGRLGTMLLAFDLNAPLSSRTPLLE